MASGDIVPIELGLTDGDLVTLWAPRWRDGDDEWEAFLGHEDALYGFESVAELAAFIRTDTDNDLVDHPAWKVVVGLSAAELEPEEQHVFDLVGVPELAAGDPDPDTLAELEETLDMVRTIGEVCELDVVTKFFGSHPVLGALPAGVSAFAGREGEELWDQIGNAIAKDWDRVVDAIDSVVHSPEVDADAVAVAEAELLAAEENVVDAEDAADTEDDNDFETVDLDEEDEEEVEETFWHEVGIDPVKIVTSEGTFFTLRCYLDDEPIFLGSGGTITVFTSERALARYLADEHEHDLARVSTYASVQTAAVDGSLEVEVDDENVYVLPGLADDLAEGPKSVDIEQLDLAVELFTDAADYAEDDTVEQSLAKSTPLGWYVSYLLEPDPSRLAPSPPFTAEAESWRALEQAFEARLQKG
ncbi:primosomal protein [Nocardia terpenica]|uniref:primosomal protein n=1 Tax=Nocardia terpenica TaxID=455432 RepID=UPI0018934179|nr:primosomal protein [Nocardia terpenica]MBF6061843.1 primosomal protein [Nocardia terpenica]MBF6106356.1 primosomal protein [Nocardia terpenica]MBF6110263.1 primosomal protein [Nocardia terpenica]MBF6120900.1 primosomal protein [Nocardia terpenica]MBF6151599.1 primosomal protein [Nocardia terpenica]